MSEPRYLRHPDIRLTELEGEGIVLHLRARKYFSVNETGLTLLEALKTPRTFDELVTALVTDYDVTPAIAAETTRDFLDQCLAAAVVDETA
jgi:predicted transcriptional regulator